MAYKRISPQPVTEGGTGNATFTAYSIVTAGTTATGTFQNVVGLGSAGQILTSAGASALPAWQTLSIPAGVPQTAKVTLTSSQIKNLHGTPQTIIAAPGAGLMIHVIGAVTTLNYGGSNAFVAILQTIGLYFNDGSGTNSLGLNVAAAFITATTTRSAPSNSLGYANALTSDLTNKPIVAYQTSAIEISGNAANDNTMTFNVTYTILTPS